MASNDRPLVQNAADPRQVAHAGRKEKQARERELEDLRLILLTAEGRRFLWRVLGYCRFATDVWDPSSRIHFNAGLQNVGHWVLAEITAADEEAFYLMMRENRDRQRRTNTEAEAIRTDRADARREIDGE